MRLLLDTHTFLWLDGSPEHLSPGALAVCEDPTNQLYLSVVSAWEIQIKHQIHRLQLEVSLEMMRRFPLGVKYVEMALTLPLCIRLYKEQSGLGNG